MDAKAKFDEMVKKRIEEKFKGYDSIEILNENKVIEHIKEGHRVDWAPDRVYIFHYPIEIVRDYIICWKDGALYLVIEGIKNHRKE